MNTRRGTYHAACARCGADRATARWPQHGGRYCYACVLELSRINYALRHKGDVRRRRTKAQMMADLAAQPVCGFSAKQAGMVVRRAERPPARRVVAATSFDGGHPYYGLPRFEGRTVAMIPA